MSSWAYLQPKQLLLLLDNFEHVLAAAPLLSEVLGTCHRLTLLVTSRSVLRVLTEYDLPVPPLALPEPKRGNDLEVVAAAPAVVLFVGRAQARKPSFALTPATATDVVAICWRLGGLPLAIELAAARITLFPPWTLLAQLDLCLQVLAGGAQDLPVASLLRAY